MQILKVTTYFTKKQRTHCPLYKNHSKHKICFSLFRLSEAQTQRTSWASDEGTQPHLCSSPQQHSAGQAQALCTMQNLLLPLSHSLTEKELSQMLGQHFNWDLHYWDLQILSDLISTKLYEEKKREVITLRLTLTFSPVGVLLKKMKNPVAVGCSPAASPASAHLAAEPHQHSASTKPVLLVLQEDSPYQHSSPHFSWNTNLSSSDTHNLRGSKPWEHSTAESPREQLRKYQSLCVALQSPAEPMAGLLLPHQPSPHHQEDTGLSTGWHLPNLKHVLIKLLSCC